MDYFRITPDSRSFTKIKLLYTVQADDHSSSDEHEIEYDVSAGA